MQRNVALKRDILQNRKPGNSAGRRALLENIWETENAIAMLQVRIVIEYDPDESANVSVSRSVGTAVRVSIIPTGSPPKP
jgi:hypothetical protein